MLLTLAILLMAVARSSTLSSGSSPVLRPVRARRLGFPVFALGLAMALVSIPSSAWASAATSTAGERAEVGAGSTAETAPKAGARAGSPGQASEYASREASARGLEKFEGGDTTVILGGSALVIILIVILIVILI